MIYTYARRRVTSSFPQLLSATVLARLEADALNSTGSVWTDRSGHEHHFTQSDASARPTKQTVDGHLAVIFNGINNWMDGGNFADNLPAFAVFTISKKLGGDINDLISKLDENYCGWDVQRHGAAIYLQDSDGSNWVYKVNNDTVDTDFMVRECELLDLASHTGHAFINGDNSHETDDSFGTVASYSNSASVKIGTDGQVSPVFVNEAVRTVLLCQITDVENWHTDRDALFNYYGALL